MQRAFGCQAFLVFLTLFWAYVGQPDKHDQSINRINPWHFGEKILRIGGFERLSFVWVDHFDYFFLFLLPIPKSPWNTDFGSTQFPSVGFTTATRQITLNSTSLQLTMKSVKGNYRTSDQLNAIEAHPSFPV